MAQSLTLGESIFSLEGNSVWEFGIESSTIEEGELGAVCTEEAASSKSLPSIPYVPMLAIQPSHQSF